MMEKKKEKEEEKKPGKKKIIIIIISAVAALIIGITAAMVIKKINEEKNKDVDLEIYWEENEISVNIGETRAVRWISNKEVKVYARSENTAVRIINIGEKEVLVEGMESGVDIVTLEAEDKVATLIIKVMGERFEFEEEEAFLQVGSSDVYNIYAEPKELLESSRITYSVEDGTVLTIKRADNGFVEVLGLKKGITYIKAQWRKKTAGIMVEVLDEAYRGILIPRDKQYLFVGQETTVKVGLEDMERGDEYNFKYELESGKNNIGIGKENGLLKVTALSEGEQYVRVRHPKARMAGNIYFDVLPQAEIGPKRIETSESPMILRKGETGELKLYVINGEAEDGKNFSYRIIENGYAVKIQQAQDRLKVEGVAPGAAKVKIKNASVTQEYDVMIIVE